MISVFSKLIKALKKKPKYTPRGCDSMGCGHFGASRGSRKHKGFDVKVSPGEPFRTQFAGIVKKIGWAYSDDLSYRIVDIKANNRMTVRAFYLDPAVSAGDKVDVGDIIGFSQDLSKKHGENMTNHVHIEIIVDDINVDPVKYLKLS